MIKTLVFVVATACTLSIFAGPASADSVLIPTKAGAPVLLKASGKAPAKPAPLPEAEKAKIITALHSKPVTTKAQPAPRTTIQTSLANLTNNTAYVTDLQLPAAVNGSMIMQPSKSWTGSSVWMTLRQPGNWYVDCSVSPDTSQGPASNNYTVSISMGQGGASAQENIVAIGGHVAFAAIFPTMTSDGNFFAIYNPGGGWYFYGCTLEPE